MLINFSINDDKSKYNISMKLFYKNIILRDARESDAKDLMRWWNDGEVMEHAGFPHGLNKSEEDIIEQINTIPFHKHLFIIEIDGNKVGEANITINNTEGELGIKICEKDYRQKGYGRLILSMMIEKLFESVDIIKLDTNYKNKRARHVYESLGFKLDTIKANGFIDQLGNPQDVVYYRLNKEDFNNYLEDYYLSKPNLRHLDTIVDYRNSIIEKNEKFQGCNGLERYEDPNEWLKHNIERENEELLPPGYVIGYEYCLIDRKNDEIIGMINIRPYIEGNDLLVRYGGNIGYSIKPNKRRKGYCKKMLSDALKVCRDEFGLDKVIITCNIDNIASENTIKSCKGIFINELFIPEENETVKRYYIEL